MYTYSDVVNTNNTHIQLFFPKGGMICASVALQKTWSCGGLCFFDLDMSLPEHQVCLNMCFVCLNSFFFMLAHGFLYGFDILSTCFSFV